MQMINEYLKDLKKIENVEAIVLYSIDNKLIDSWTDSNFNAKVLEDMSLHYFQVFATLDLNGQDYQEIVISHEKGHFYTRIYPDILLIVVVKTTVEISLIRLITNVKIAELLHSRQLQKMLKKTGIENKDFLNKKNLDESESEYLKKMEI
jgi:predicted regulator of Ras-like GTPase activity (Roadblock/LC7/MglB family)